MEARLQPLWDEWSSLPLAQPVEDEITGILDGLPYSVRQGDYIFRSGRLFTVRRLMRLWGESQYQKSHGGESGIRLLPVQQKNCIHFGIKAEAAESFFQRGRSFARRSRNWGWVRGLWGACGALYIPKTGYYLVLRPPVRNGAAERMQGIFKSAGFAVGVRKKSGGKELMLRDQQQITTFLSRMGFTSSILQLEETAIFRQVRSHANKLVNCDSANINKSLEAARSQLRLIESVEADGLLGELPEPLRELIFARKNNPSMSLKELGQTLPRPISKSTVEYRWRKLESIVHSLERG